MLRLYLVRHGETEANQQGVYYGRTDLPLSAQGISQAQHLATLLSPVSFSDIIVSGLSRAQQTAQLIKPLQSAQFRQFPEFNEMDFGDWEGCHYQQLMVQDKQRYQAWCDDWIHQGPPQGESYLQFKSRIKLGLERLLMLEEQHQESQNILLVSHQGVLKVMMLLLLSLPEQAFWSFTFQHGRYSLVEIEHQHTTIKKLNIG